jgi:glycosyltransferase involved in cell wall biosynthesis
VKVLWMGDAGSHTGFARVTHSIGERLVEMGHDVHVLAYNHKGDHYPTTLKLYRPNLVLDSDLYGTTRIIEMLGRVGPDVVVMLNDPQVLLQLLFENQYDPERYLLRYRPILTYIPCDGTNLPPQWTELLPKVTNVVAMSRWGQQHYEGSKLVYHGVDTDLFWPVDQFRPITTSNGEVLRSKRDCKRAFGFDVNGFLVLRIDKNSGRKDYAATWKALAPVMKRYKDIQVHFHAAASQLAHGVNLPVLFTREPEIDINRYFFPDLHNTFIGWSQQDLNALYNAADIFVSTSRGEGFGLTLAESLACGVPVIAQNVSAIPEVVGPGGILLEPQRLITVPSGEDTWLADIDAFSEAIERLYTSAGARRGLGEAGREHVERSFSWDVAAARFDEYIEALASITEAENAEPVGVGGG